MLGSDTVAEMASQVAFQYSAVAKDRLHTCLNGQHSTIDVTEFVGIVICLAERCAYLLTKFEQLLCSPERLANHAAITSVHTAYLLALTLELGGAGSKASSSLISSSSGSCTLFGGALLAVARSLLLPLLWEA